jgi:hypothetical protein
VLRDRRTGIGMRTGVEDGGHELGVLHNVDTEAESNTTNQSINQSITELGTEDSQSRTLLYVQVYCG